MTPNRETTLDERGLAAAFKAADEASPTGKAYSPGITAAIRAYLSTTGAPEAVAWLVKSNSSGNTWVQLSPKIAKADVDFVSVTPLYAAPLPAASGVGVKGVTDEMVERATQAMRHITFNALTMDECRDAARAALEAALVSTPAAEGVTDHGWKALALGMGAHLENLERHCSVQTGRVGNEHAREGVELREAGRKFIALVKAALAALPAPQGWRECATEGCYSPATIHFERGGIGSHYCYSCYMRIQALPASPAPEGGQP